MPSFPRLLIGFAVAASPGAILLLLIGCTGAPKEQKGPVPQPVTKVAPPTPIQTKRVELGGPNWNSDWDGIIERSLPPAMLSSRVPRDVQRFCPRFYKMSAPDKREFWAYFFQALAAAEAGLNATANVRHTEPKVSVRDAVTGKLVRSEGLLQLAYEDKQRYGCAFDWRADSKLSRDDAEKTILNPTANLECGVKILTAQIIQHHKLLLSRAGYWSTLHPGTAGFRVFSRQMTNPPAACRPRTIRSRGRVQNRKLAREGKRRKR